MQKPRSPSPDDAARRHPLPAQKRGEGGRRARGPGSVTPFSFSFSLARDGGLVTRRGGPRLVAPFAFHQARRTAAGGAGQRLVAPEGEHWRASRQWHTERERRLCRGCSPSPRPSPPNLRTSCGAREGRWRDGEMVKEWGGERALGILGHAGFGDVLRLRRITPAMMRVIARSLRVVSVSLRKRAPRMTAVAGARAKAIGFTRLISP